MNIDMLPIEIVGLKAELTRTVDILRQLGFVQIETLADMGEISARPLSLAPEILRSQEEMSVLLARIEGLLDLLPGEPFTQREFSMPQNPLEEARENIETLLPKVQHLTAQQEKLKAELSSLPRYEATLRKLLPIIPSSARRPGNVTVGVLVSRLHVGVLDSIGKKIMDMTEGLADVIASDVGSSTHAMLVVFPQEFTAEVETMLGREDVSRLRLPAELGQGPPDVILGTLQHRINTIPLELKDLERQMALISKEWSLKLAAWRRALQEALEKNAILSHFGETDQTFVIGGWVPDKYFPELIAELKDAVGETVLVRRLALTAEMKKQAPIILKNPAAAQPFESLVNLLALPRYGRIDPTQLMAFFLPIFFGMILGDIGYGLVLLALSLTFTRRIQPGTARDILKVLAIGAGWSVVFGVLYGEAFGTLGEHWGLHAVWFDRASSEHVAGLLVMTLAVGAVHLTLGLVLGVLEAARDKSRGHLLERGGMLVGLISLFILVGALSGYLPDELKTPAWAGMLTGITLLGASMGWLGVLMGPIEFIGLIGNLLSYLRIAAIGLASVYLAKVANDIAGMAGNLVVGAIIAVLIHALNLVLGAFSPTIHSLRLHYVEFFRKFYEGGGRAYQPYKSNF